jgi:hypothetical protein
MTVRWSGTNQLKEGERSAGRTQFKIRVRLIDRKVDRSIYEGYTYLHDDTPFGFACSDVVECECSV